MATRVLDLREFINKYYKTTTAVCKRPSFTLACVTWHYITSNALTLSNWHTLSAALSLFATCACSSSVTAAKIRPHSTKRKFDISVSRVLCRSLSLSFSLGCYLLLLSIAACHSWRTIWKATCTSYKRKQAATPAATLTARKKCAKSAWIWYAAYTSTTKGNDHERMMNAKRVRERGFGQRSTQISQCFKRGGATTLLNYHMQPQIDRRRRREKKRIENRLGINKKLKHINYFHIF